MKIQELSTSEKVILAQRLWDSAIADDKSIAISNEQRDELDSRLAAYEFDGELGDLWSKVKDRLLKS